MDNHSVLVQLPKYLISITILLLFSSCGSDETGMRRDNRNRVNQDFPYVEYLLGEKTSQLPGIGEITNDPKVKDDLNVLAGFLELMSAGQQQELKFRLADKIDSCSFLPISSGSQRGMIPSGCKSGNVSSCVSGFTSLAGNLFMSSLNRLGDFLGPISGSQVREAIAAEMGLCSSISLDNPYLVQSEMKKKLKQCKKGKIRGCIGLLLLFLKSMLGGLLSMLFGGI